MPDITYVGRSEGDYFELFHLMADGETGTGLYRRPVLEILVDPTNSIWIAGVGGYGVLVPQITDGRAHRHQDEEFEALGIDTNHVCLGSIVAYIIPRVATFMARVYCPAPARQNAQDAQD